MILASAIGYLVMLATVNVGCSKSTPATLNKISYKETLFLL
jgi:hypothetical protein